MHREIHELLAKSQELRAKFATASAEPEDFDELEETLRTLESAEAELLRSFRQQDLQTKRKTH